MQEVEILVKIDEDLGYCLAKISEKLELVKTVRVIDAYFDHKWISKLNPDQSFRLTNCVRVREKGDRASVAYKHDYFDENDIWTYSDEYETNVESAQAMKDVFYQLWFTELVVVNNLKHYFYDGDYEIVVEDVDGLGVFLEVEFRSIVASWDEATIKLQINKYIKDLGFDNYEEMNAWKPELILKKKSLYKI